MKTFKKVLASTLAAAMVVTALPVTPANAAATPKLSTKKATVYVGQSKTIKVTTPKAWKSVKVKATTSKKSVATVKTSKKKITVKAVKAGTAKVTVKVTGKKSGKAVKKTLKATITVKNPSLTLTATSTEVAVGAKETVKATVKPASTKVTFSSSDDTIATVDATTGEVTGVKAGKVTITAKAGKTTKTVDMEVKTAIFKGIAQKSTKTLEATFAGDTKSLKATDFKITNTFNNVVYAVKDVTVDAKDATKVTLTTYMDMKDAKEYTVEYDGTTQKFTATDGTVVTLGLDKTTIDAATETEIQAQTKDANGVVIDSYKYGDAKVTMTVNVTNGYMTGASKLYLNKAGDTATVDLTYHKGTFDATGKEEVIEQKGITVTAVDPEKVTVAGWAVKIGDAGKTFDKVTETKIAVGDSKTAYVQVTNSKNEKSVDLSAYTVESSNNDALIITSSDLKKGTIALQAVKEGTSYILVKDAKTGAVVTTLAVTVSAARKASSIELDKTAVTLSSTIKEKAAVKVTVKDQYGEKLAIEKNAVETLSYTDAKGKTSKPASDSFKSAKFEDGAYTFEADGVATGKYVVKVSANGLSRTVNIEVVEASKDATTSYAFDMSASKADATITADTEKDATITATIYQLKGGVKNAVIKNVTATLKKADGTDAAIAPAVNDGVVTVAANKLSDGSKLEAGTYTLTVTPTDTKNVPTFTRNIVITDSQTAATFKRVSESGKTIDSCFEFYLNGEKITTTETPVFYYGDKEITKPEGATPVTKAVITYKLGKNTVKQTVNIGLTVTITK